jgi:hypothetical protein
MHSTAQRRVDLRGTSEPAGGHGGVRHPARGLAAGARVPAGDPGIAGPCRFSACVKGSKCARRGAIGTYGCAAALNQMGCRALSRMGRLDDYRRYAKECLDMRTPSKTQNRAPPCYKWHRYGCAWHRRTMPRSTPIRAANKSLPDQSPSQVSPKPGPFPPKSAAAARFLPVAPNGGIPLQSAGIGLTVPCNGNRPADEPFRMHSAPCGWNRMSRGADAHRCGCNGHHSTMVPSSIGATIRG